MAQAVTDVLCVGMNDAAMQTRKLVLEKAGLNVSQARDIRQVQAACESNSFAVVILGHSLNRNEKKRVSDVVLTIHSDMILTTLGKTWTIWLSESDTESDFGARLKSSLSFDPARTSSQ
jgi:deoxyribose-phosphate aldolase